MPEFLELPVEDIAMNTSAQSRASMNIEIVEEYAAAMARGDIFPAIVVFEEEDYPKPHLADGWYRMMAAKQANIKTIMSEVHKGTLDDAILYAVGANAVHGLRRTNEDKRKSVMMLLENEKWKGMSDRAIAEAARVDHKTVAKIRAELQVGKSSPEGDEPRTVTGKDKKQYPAGGKKKQGPEGGDEKPERTPLDTLRDISALYTELPRSPEETAEELYESGTKLGTNRADHIAWWFGTYAGTLRKLVSPAAGEAESDSPPEEQITEADAGSRASQ